MLKDFDLNQENYFIFPTKLNTLNLYINILFNFNINIKFQHPYKSMEIFKF